MKVVERFVFCRCSSGSERWMSFNEAKVRRGRERKLFGVCDLKDGAIFCMEFMKTYMKTYENLVIEQLHKSFKWIFSQPTSTGSCRAPTFSTQRIPGFA